MKKTLSILSIAALLATVSPSVMAEPGGGHGGPGGGHGAEMGRMHGGGPQLGGHHGDYRPAPDYHRHHGGSIALGLGARHSYWGYPYGYYRLGWYDDFYPPYCCGRPIPRPVFGGAGIYINF